MGSTGVAKMIVSPLRGLPPVCQKQLIHLLMMPGWAQEAAGLEGPRAVLGAGLAEWGSSANRCSWPKRRTRRRER